VLEKTKGSVDLNFVQERVQVLVTAELTGNTNAAHIAVVEFFRNPSRALVYLANPELLSQRLALHCQ
jgi:hypothetical protein